MNYEKLQEKLADQELRVGTYHSSLVDALSAIKRAAERRDLSVFEQDIRTVGDRGLQPLKTTHGSIRAQDQIKDELMRIVFRIHRSPSDTFIIDFCSLQKV